MIGFRDARDFQILFLSVFLVLGVWARDFSVKPAAVAVILITSFAVQWVINKDSMKSAAITGISLCLLLRANSLWPLALASAIAIASKAVFRFRGKHFFNPSNLGIIAALALTGNSWVTPGQWGTDLWLFLLFCARVDSSSVKSADGIRPSLFWLSMPDWKPHATPGLDGHPTYSCTR